MIILNLVSVSYINLKFLSFHMSDNKVAKELDRLIRDMEYVIKINIFLVHTTCRKTVIPRYRLVGNPVYDCSKKLSQE